VARDIRVGLIGYGLGGEFFHAPLIAVTPGLRLVSVVTSNPERRERALRDHPGVRVESDTRSLFARAADHDLIVITTDNRSHVPLALEALSAGLGVVVDKPFAASPAEGWRVIAEAKRRGLFLSVYQNRRWDSDTLTVKRLLAQDVFGKVVRFESRFERWRPDVKNTWRERPDFDDAGGLLYDLGSHGIDQALHLFGPVRDVYAELDRRRPGAQVDDDDFLALTHVSGVRSHIRASVVTGIQAPRIRVLGTRAAYVKQYEDIQEALLRAGRRPTDPEYGIEPMDRWGVLGSGDQVERVPTEPGAYHLYYQGVAASMRDGAPPPVLPEEAVAGLEIIAAAQTSAAERRVVSLKHDG
jgi:predicted dehydrogenase